MADSSEQVTTFGSPSTIYRKCVKEPRDCPSGLSVCACVYPSVSLSTERGKWHVCIGCLYPTNRHKDEEQRARRQDTSSRAGDQEMDRAVHTHSYRRTPFYILWNACLPIAIVRDLKEKRYLFCKPCPAESPRGFRSRIARIYRARGSVSVHVCLRAYMYLHESSPLHTDVPCRVRDLSMAASFPPAVCHTTRATERHQLSAEQERKSAQVSQSGLQGKKKVFYSFTQEDRNL